MKRLFAALFLAAMCIAPVCAQTPREALAQARAHLDALSSYHLRLNDETGVTEVDYTPPSRVRITTSGSVGVIVGGGVYINVGGAGWTPAAVNTTFAVLITTLAEDRLISFTDEDEVTDQGTQALDGVTLHAYEIRTPVNGSFLRRTVWVGEKDGLPHRVERSGGTTVLTAVYSAFNQDFGIEVPSGLQPATQR